jgi:hypothetical protein
MKRGTRAAPLCPQVGRDAGCQLLPGLRDCPAVFGVQMSNAMVYQTLINRG